MIAWAAEHAGAALCIVITCAGSVAAIVTLIARRIASGVGVAPDSAKQSTAAQQQAGTTEQAKAQAAAARVLVAPQSAIDAEVERLRKRGKEGK